MTDQDKTRKVPQHIGIIMDGNGRWAKSKGLSRVKGHRQGAETTRRIIEACKEFGVSHLTLYAFSAENWNRPESEVKALMELLELFLAKELKSLVKQGIRLRAIGRIDELPARTRKALEGAIEKTRTFTDWNLTLALNYSSRNELTDAVRSIAKDAQSGEIELKEINWDLIAARLYTAEIPDPDLIIRTSGETRLSNFLMMQSAYAELFFTPVFWPDFTKEHLREAIESFQKRERRFGLTGDQLAAPPILA